MITALVSAGVFFAVPVVGRLVLGPLPRPLPALAKPSLWVAAGMAVWSVPLLLLLILGMYHPALIGAAGWLTVAVLVATKRVGRLSIPRLRPWDRIALAGLLLAAGLGAAFPADPFTTGSDQNTYASHALYIAHHGRLDVPGPWPQGDIAPAGFQGYPGVYFTEPSLTVQFGHLFPAWLAQTYATTGYEGMVRLNVVLGLLALLAIYGLARRFVHARLATVGILFLAFNPAQIWVARQTLTEIPTQLLMWCGLLLLTAYLARGKPAWGVWAGILLGMSAFVRIDAFLLIPFLLTAHALWSIVSSNHRRPSTRPSWSYLYLGSAPLFGLALAYYVLLSRPYLLSLGSQVLQIGALVAAGAALLALTRVPRVAEIARAALAHRAIVLGLLAVLAALTAYAYFIRPLLPPFDIIDAPGRVFDGERSYIEDALPNVGRYLTPGVVWAALIGWSALFLAVCRRSRAAVVVAPLLVVALGATAIYAWEQSVFPNHFWAIRRFIPLSIPAMVLFACVGGAVLLRRLSRSGRRLAAGGFVSLLVIFTVWIGGPMYLVAERQGSYAALGEFAGSVPTNGYVLAVDGDYEALRYWMPLYLAFDRPIIPLDPTNDAARGEAISRLRAASPEKPLTFVTGASDFRMDAVEGTRIGVSWSSQSMAETTNPVPRAITRESVNLTKIEATGLNTIGVRFGGPPQWLAPVSGFHRPQLVDGRPLRWTDGEGRLSIPIEGDAAPARLAVSLADTGPTDGPLRITLNGVTLYDGVVAAGPWSAEWDLAGIVELRQGDTAELEILSDTFLDAPVDRFDRETRFGVQVEHVTLLAE